jgi:Mg2+ and Co2+ transporter CorA
MKYKVIRNLPDLVFELGRVKLSLHEIDMRDMRGRVYISKLEKRDKYTFVVLEQPDYDKQKKQFNLKEVFFLLLPKVLLVYDPQHSRYIDQFFAEVEQNQFRTATPAGLLLGMLDFFSTQMYRAIPKFSNEVTEVQDKVLDESDDTDLIGNVHRIKRNLITFNSVLEPVLDLNKTMLLHKEFTASQATSDTLEEYSERIEKIIKSIRNFEKQMDVLSDSNESQMVRKTNRNIGILTTLNALLLLPTIVIEVWRLLTDHQLLWSDWLGLGVGFAVLSIGIVVYLMRAKII